MSTNNIIFCQPSLNCNYKIYFDLPVGRQELTISLKMIIIRDLNYILFYGFGVISPIGTFRRSGGHNVCGAPFT